MRHVPQLACILAATALVACGGAAPAPNAPAAATAPAAEAPAADAPAAEETEPQTVEEAQAAIARARQQIDALGSSGGAAPTMPEHAPTTIPTSPADSPAEPSTVPSQGAAEAPSSRSCPNACRALSSMRRAVEALCRLSGEDEASCKEARGTLAQSEKRTARCGCD